MIARPPLVVPLLALLALAALTTGLVVDPALVARLDAPVTDGLRAYAADRPTLVAVLRTATDLAATLSFLAVGAAATTLFAVRRDRARAWFCATVTVAAPVSWQLGQWLLHRPRPADGFVTIAANGFPSGHTTNAAAAAFAVVLLVWPGVRRTGRLLVAVLAGAGALFIAATRLVLLAHWPVDVIGGVLVAVTVVALAARLWAPRAGGPAAAGPVPGKVSSRDGSCEVRSS